MSDQETERISKAELIKRMHRAYETMLETLRPLQNQQLAQPGPEGWAVKDHLVHLAVWEEGIAALLQGRPRYVDAELKAAVDQGKSEEEINEMIHRQNAGLSPAEALEKYQAAHQHMLQALEGLSDEDLYKPYEAYLTDGSHRADAGSDAPQAPVINWIIGNSYEHYQDHNRWIRELLEAIG